MAEKNVAIIGGGWAGCSAAVELARKGRRVTLMESGKTLGGRARRVKIDGTPLDNGQHIMLGAYSESLRMMESVGVDAQKNLLRLPLQMRYPENSDGMTFVAGNLPAPFHLLTALIGAKGLEWEDKLALTRFMSALRWMKWTLNKDIPLISFLEQHQQTIRLYKLLWRPLSIAALNTPPENASAKIFINVLRDSIGKSRRASEMLIPKTDLSSLFSESAASFIEKKGGKVLLGKYVQDIEKVNDKWKIDGDFFDAVVIATPPNAAKKILPESATDFIPDFEYEPIATCYLRYPRGTRLNKPFYALIDDAKKGNWGQFVFDRGHLDAEQSGIFAVVISAAKEAIENENDKLIKEISKQLAQSFNRDELKNPIAAKLLTEKRATIKCTPNLPRPKNKTPIPSLVIAGDYTESDYPATLESAVRSGIIAAKEITENE